MTKSTRQNMDTPKEHSPTKRTAVHVHAKNFRGFTSVDLEVRDVNFVVGDNSSGKTSLIYLVSSVLSRDFSNSFDIFSSGSPLFTLEDIRSPFIDDDITVVGFTVLAEREKNEIVVARFAEYSHKEKNATVAKKVGALTGGNARIVFRKNRKIYAQDVDVEDRSGRERIKVFRKAWDDLQAEYYLHKFPFPDDVDRMPKFLPFYFFDFDEGVKNVSTPHMNFSFGFEVLRYGPMRLNPQHAYSSFAAKRDESGSHTPEILKRIYERRRSAKNAQIIRKIDKFGSQSGMFDSIVVNSYKKSDSKAPFEIQIRKGGKVFSIDEVGYGVSQILPVLVDSIRGADDGAMLVIQQPELHLHPKAQAAFGELVFELAGEGVKFFIETHSDYIIDRYRYCLPHSKKKPEFDSGIVFSFNTERGNKLHQIVVDEDGAIGEAPPEYRAFFLEEEGKIFDMIWR